MSIYNGHLSSGSAGSTITITAGEDLLARDAVYISVGSADGSRTAGRAYKVDATNDYRIEFIGFATSAIASAATGIVRVSGELDGFSALTGGTGMFASVTVPGSYQQTAPSTSGHWLLQLGNASSTTRCLINGAGSASAVKITPDGSAISASYEISNLGLATSVGSNALTIALKQADGATDPTSSAGAVKVGMRSVTLTSGLYNQRSVTGALSLVVSSGSTLGQTSTKPWMTYIYLIDNAGTLELAVSGSLFYETQVVSTTAEGGAGAADTVTVMYSASARSNVPCRLIGKLLNTQTTAGTWASAGTTLQVGDLAALTTFTGPTVQTLTSGSSTYYTPAGVKWLEVEMVGGGGGGGEATGGATGSTGGNTTFGTSLLTANGGVGGSGTSAGPSAGGSATVSAPAIQKVALTGTGGDSGFTAVATMFPTSGAGGSSPFGGRGPSRINNSGDAAIANTGSGGSGGGGAAGGQSGSGGAAGGYIKAIITTPVSSYAYAVGASGAGGTGNAGNDGGPGGSGIIIVTEYYQ